MFGGGFRGIGSSRNGLAALEELEELKAIRSQYHLDDKSSDKDTRAAGTTAYVSLIVENVSIFLSAHRDEFFTEDRIFLKQYQELERARLNLLGL